MDEKITIESVLAALREVEDPELRRDLVSLNMIRDLEVNGETVSFTLMLTTPACPLKGTLEKQAREAVLAIPGVKKVNIKMDANVPSDGRQRALFSLPIRNVLAVASGKGGVGKSTVSVNIAVSLAQSGARVGLLDADIYGPNIPTMMGVSALGGIVENKLIPAEAYNVRLMSMGFLVQPGQPLIWRGPMLHSAIRQFLSDVQWGELDYLIVDLPPGTGDAPLSLAQSIPLSGVIIVTLPQAVSLEDASRGVSMFQTLNTPILGVIENMRGEFFGAGGGEKLARASNVPFLGAIPMEAAVRQSSDNGQPIVIAHPDSDAAIAFKAIAKQVAARLSVEALRAQAVM